MRSIVCVGAATAALLWGGGPDFSAVAAGVRGRDSKQIDSRYTYGLQLAVRSHPEDERGAAFAKLVRGDPRSRTIALTFDDGPHAGRTEQLLGILRQEKVRATFFVVGKMVERNPYLLKMEVADGHEVASHTYSHLRLPPLSSAQIEQELRAGAAAIQRLTGVPVRYCRPPGGEYDDRVAAITKRLGQTMVLWTADPADFVFPAPSIIEQRILRKIENGGIILLHDGIPQTMAMLPDLIHRLKARGFRFVTCSEMAREQGVITRGGPSITPGKIRLDRLRAIVEKT